MLVRCTNKKCLHEWNFTGDVSEEKRYIRCSKCNYKSMLKRAKIQIQIHTPIDTLTHPNSHTQINETEEERSRIDALDFEKITPDLFEEKEIEKEVFTNITDFTLAVLKDELETGKKPQIFIEEVNREEDD